MGREKAHRLRGALPAALAAVAALLAAPAPLLGAAPPRDSAALRETRAILPARFRILETRRFVVLSDAGPAWTAAQAQTLERAHHQFQRLARRLGLRPRPLPHKLVCVLFDRRADYRRFATAHDEVTDPWIAGYYAPDHDRIVFYHGASNPSVLAARDRLAQMRSDLATVTRDLRLAQREGRATWAHALAAHRRRFAAHLAQETSRVDAFTTEVDTATTVHEALHQLLFDTRIQSSRHPSPVWISEGLATAFETDRPGTAFGPDHEYAPRREAFTALLGRGHLLDLDRLVALVDLPDDERFAHVVYNQSYALVTWMTRFRRRELRSYLDHLRAEPDGPLTPARARALFRQAFGDEAELEQSWLRHERRPPLAGE